MNASPCTILRPSGAGGTLQRAADHLARFLGGRIAAGDEDTACAAPGPIVALGIPGREAWFDRLLAACTGAGSQPLPAGAESYSILSAPASGWPGEMPIVIAAASERAALYAAHHFEERVRLGQPAEGPWNVREAPAVEFRAAWLWERFEGSHAHYSGHSPDKSLFQWAAVAHPESNRWGEVLGRLASFRLNTLVIGFEWLYTFPTFIEHATELRALVRFAATFGLDTFISIPYELDPEWQATQQNPLCPYSPALRAAWEERLGRLLELIPEIAGIHIVGKVGQVPVADAIPRGPSHCQCPRCRSASLVERGRVGYQWLYDLIVGRHGRRIVARAMGENMDQDWTYDYWVPLARQLPPDFVVECKEYYGDHQIHGYKHPLIGYVANLCVQLQPLNEYRGRHIFPSSMAWRWAASTFAHGDAVKGFTAPTVDHGTTLSLGPRSSEYVYGRLAWNPHQDPARVLCDWATLEYGPLAAPAIVDLLHKGIEAFNRAAFLRGLFFNQHSYLVPRVSLQDWDQRCIDMWTGAIACPKWKSLIGDGMLGYARDITVYPADDQCAIRADPWLRAIFEKIPFSNELKEEEMAIKRSAVAMAREMVADWRAARPKLPDGLYQEVLRTLEAAVYDFLAWQYQAELYFDYKLGQVTEDKIAEACQACGGRNQRTLLTAEFEDFLADVAQAAGVAGR